ncbi:MAG: NAD-dependent epimerase/dehydratase family protein [Kiritimatiellae bacterium]|nr:NAD-dependent epimerase/dehydratase family protein [Kiritimatiellia bacterium]
MKFLITGAYGFVGTNLCKYLTEKGHECIALDLPAAKREGVPYNSFYSWDQLDSLPEVDAVVHLAGKAHDLKKVSKPESYFEINVGLTQKIFTATEKKAKRFIYFSSIKALDGDTPYAQSKREAEKWLDGRAIVLEPAMIHGPGNKGNLNLLTKVVKKGIPWPLAKFENKRSFTSIGNICAAVEALAERGKNGIYPICDDELVGTNRLIELIAEAYETKPRLWRVPKWMMTTVAAIGSVIHLPLNKERLGKLTEDSVADNSAVKAELGWSAMPIRAEDGLRATLKEFVRAERQEESWRYYYATKEAKYV